MIQEAQSDELRAALSEHLEVTKTQAEWIESISEELGYRDAAIIAASQRVEDYEMAGYGAARAYAERLGYDGRQVCWLRVLEEEKEAHETLSGLAEGISLAAQQAEVAQEAEVKTGKSAKGVRATAR
jgi:ferritin-like metal-binding protein YciE